MNRPLLRGLDLSEAFYQEAVKPILTAHFPDLSYSAALIGPGSEVLGFDDVQSTDHDWGPRLQLFLAAQDHAAHHASIDQQLRAALPANFRGYPRSMACNPERTGRASTPEDHSVEVTTINDFFGRFLHFDPCGEVRAIDWLRVPDYLLLTLVRGRVFHDGLGQLAAIRERLTYYPHEVWLYLLAAQWKRISQEEAFMGRCGQVGDELGSRLVAARLVRDLMKLAFLQERQYAPYSKWFGTAFARLNCAGELMPILLEVTAAQTWQARETQLSAAYRYMAEKQNALALTPPLSPAVRPYYNRPFQVINADRFVAALRAAITSEEVLALPEQLGAVDQFLDSTDAFNHLYRGGLQQFFQP